ncbi:MAG: FkbM family methyltransferase [Thiohalocapsa sp.]
MTAAPLPTSTFEERLKHALIPGRCYIRYRALKEWRRGEQEVRLLPQLVDRRRNAVDVGANKGTYTYFLARLARQVYAFEPNPKMYAVLRRTIARNVIAYPTALSDCSGTASLRVPYGRKGFSNQGSSLSAAKPMENFMPIEVESRRLDELGLADIGFIKIDVEGHERAVLSGAAETIARDRPILLVEIEEAHTGEKLAQSLAWISGLGYDAYFVAGGGLQPVASLNAADHGYIFNFVFLPREGHNPIVPGLDPGISFAIAVDGPIKPGHDELKEAIRSGPNVGFGSRGHFCRK